jgi:hypothetical protein
MLPEMSMNGLTEKVGNHLSSDNIDPNKSFNAEGQPKDTVQDTVQDTNNDFDSSSDEDLSYTKLMKHIQNNHPMDPDTMKKFMPSDSITVKNFYIKLIDPLNFYSLILLCKKINRKIQKM